MSEIAPLKPKPWRTILVGVGRMGRNHLRVLLESPQYSLAAIVDENIEKIQDLTLPSTIQKFTTLERCLADTSFEVAVVAASTEYHFSIAKTLIEAGKHVLIEKPIATNFADALTLVELSKKHGTTLKVGHLERLNPAVRKLKEVIESGGIGTPIHFSFTRVGGYPSSVANGNNVLLDLAVHDIDVLHFLAGTKSNFDIRGVAAHSTWQPGILDTAEVLLENSESVSASIHVNWITPTKIRNLRITGTHGVCLVDYILQTCTLLGGQVLKNRSEPKIGFQDLITQYQNTDRTEFGVDKEEPLKVQLKEFNKALLGKPSSVCDAMAAAQAVDIAYRALETQKEKAQWQKTKKVA